MRRWILKTVKHGDTKANSAPSVALGNSRTLPLPSVTASPASKWAIDQVIDNALTVKFGKKVMEYIKLPDGTWSAPSGVTTRLVPNGDSTYSLLERFGTRMNFNSNKQISSITDIDGNDMAFAYDGSNRLKRLPMLSGAR